MFIAWREFRRSPGRFALLVGAVALLVLLLLFFQSVAGALTSGITGGVDNNRADVFVYTESARQNPSASFFSPDSADGVATSITAVDGVDSVTVAGISTFVAGDLDVVVIGIDGDLTAAGPRSLADGDWPAGAGQALFAGSALTDSFDLGEVVTIAGIDLEVVGVADDAAFDVSPTLYVAWDDYVALVQAKAQAPIDPPRSWFAVTLGDAVADPDDAASAIEAAVDGVEALPRDVAATALPGAGQISQSFSVLYLLLFIVVTIVTGVFFLILTVQKQRSLVLLRAIGAGRRDIVTPVLVQVLGVVGVGSVVGAAAAAGLLRLAQGTFGSSLDPTTTAVSIALIVALGLLASVGAVRRVLAVDPLEATTGGAVGGGT